jgi:WD40 repeat protein
VTTPRLWCSLVLVLLAPAPTLRAADNKDAVEEPLPLGAKARLNTGLRLARSGVGYLLPPDFRSFLVGGWAHGRPHVFDTRTGKATAVPGFEPVGRGPFRDGTRIMAVSADGKRAVTDRGHDKYLVFEIATGKEIGTAPRDVVGTRVSMSADGKVMAFDVTGKGATREVVVWDVEKGAELARVTGLRGFSVSTLLSPDGKTLATSVTEIPNLTVCQLWSVATSKQIATLPDAHIGGAALFSPDGKTLLTASDGAVQFWDAATGKPGAVLLGRSNRLVKLAYSPDGKTLAGLAANWAVERWALPDGKPLKSTPFPLADLLPYESFPGAFGVAFVDNDRAVAWGELWGSALMWEAPGGKLLTPVTGHVGAITAVRFTAGGKEVLTAGADRRVFRWDAATGRRTGVVVAAPQQQQLNNLLQFPYHHLSPDGSRGLRDRSLFDVGAGEELFGLPVRDPTPSNDFRRIVGVSWGQVGGKNVSTYDVWDTEDRRRVARLELPDGVVRPNDGAVAFSPDNSRLVAAVPVTEPGARWPVLVVGWEVASGKRLGELREPTQGFGTGDQYRPHLAPAGNNSGVVLATDDGKLWVADYERGERGETIAELAGPQRRFVHPTFSTDGKTFAVGAPTEKPDAYEVRVYDWPRGRLVHTFVGHRAPVTALAFAPDGRTLASGSLDGSVLLWDTGTVPAPK